VNCAAFASTARLVDREFTDREICVVSTVESSTVRATKGNYSLVVVDRWQTTSANFHWSNAQTRTLASVVVWVRWPARRVRNVRDKQPRCV